MLVLETFDQVPRHMLLSISLRAFCWMDEILRNGDAPAEDQQTRNHQRETPAMLPGVISALP